MNRRRVLLFRAGPATRPRQNLPGAFCWRLVDEHGTFQACEIRPPAARRGRWLVVLWLDDAVQFSRPCADRAAAEFVAQALREDQLLGGARPIGRLREFSGRR